MGKSQEEEEENWTFLKESPIIAPGLRHRKQLEAKNHFLVYLGIKLIFPQYFLSLSGRVPFFFGQIKQHKVHDVTSFSFLCCHKAFHMFAIAQRVPFEIHLESFLSHELHL